MHDLHNNSRTRRVITPVAVGTTGTGQTGKVVDRQGFGGVEFILSYGAITATNATMVVVVKEGDSTGTLTSVADADLLGTELLAGVAMANPRTSGTSKNTTRRVGYRGKKRYVQANVYSTITAATIVSCTALLHSPTHAPTTNP